MANGKWVQKLTCGILFQTIHSFSIYLAKSKVLAVVLHILACHPISNLTSQLASHSPALGPLCFIVVELKEGGSYQLCY